LAYQPPASSTFLSEEISHQQSVSSTFSQNKPTPTANYQPNEQAAHRKLARRELAAATLLSGISAAAV
jgi:hypothetical protein